MQFGLLAVFTRARILAPPVSPYPSQTQIRASLETLAGKNSEFSKASLEIVRVKIIYA
jgi:hypothetical protein